jgi:putative DNA primase/helicase
MSGVMKMLQSKRLVEFEKFDPEGKHLVNFLNGTFELHTGVFRESRREDMLTQTMPVPFVQGATCDNWNQFLENSFPDADVREFLQRFFGYMLAGTGQEKYALFFHGYGDNGKTILMSVLMSLFGFKSENAYGKAVGWDTFTESKSGTIRNDIARLHNSRAVFCDESEEGMVLKESMFKAVTGMSPITVRFLHKEYFTFMSRFVFVLATNRLPRVIGGDGATWRRILKVPMTESFPPGHAKRIENLEAVLMAERDGVAQWVAEGYRKYKQDGLKVPASILDASAEYRENSDSIEAFLAEVIQKAEGGRERFDVVYNRYASWCRGKNEKERARDSLIDILKSRGYQLRRHPSETGRPLYVYGMALVPDQTGRVFGRSDMENLSNDVTFEVLTGPTGSVAWTGSDGQRHMD